MIVDSYVKLIEKQGYMRCTTDFPQVRLGIKQEAGCFLTIRIIDCNDKILMTHKQYEEQSQYVRDTHSASIDFHVLTVIFFDDYKKALELASDDHMCWLIDKSTMQFVEDTTRVEDFYGIKSSLLEYLSEYKACVETGDMRRLDEFLMDDYEKQQKEKIKRKKPIPVTVLLISATITVFLTYLLVGEAFIASGCMYPALILKGQIYRLVTPIFLHEELDHIASNMILLYFLGEIIESKLGSIKFLFIYVISGIFANIVSCIYCLLFSDYVSYGASGAIYGMVGVFVIMAIKRFKGIDIPKNRLILMLAYGIYSSFSGNTDFAAHIGGLVAGLVLGLIMLAGGKKSEG